MDRDDTHQQRIQEVKEALAELHKLQAELARRDTSTQLAVLHSRSTDVIVDERHDGSRGSGLGPGVVALLILTAAAAGLVSAGQTDVARWTREQWADGVRKATSAYMPAVASVMDHLPTITALIGGDDQLATPRNGGPTLHRPAEPDGSSATQDPDQPEGLASLPHDMPVGDEEAAAGAPPELSDTPARQAPLPRRLPAPSSESRPRHDPLYIPQGLPPPIPPADVRVVVLREARTLVEANQLEAAREKLRSHSPERHADIAWALARTYDPRHLRSLGADAATGDVDEAEKWYRRWYAIGVESGLVSKSFRIDRLIEAMRQR
jgi:hypothetical protein